MNPTWKEALGAVGACFNDSRSNEVDSFGDAAGELFAARDATVLAPLTHLGVIRVGGEDAKSFLHNQLTSDINHLGIDSAQHSAWCSAKGRMLASFVIWRDGSDYLLALAADLQPAIAKRLQMYVLRAKVTIADADLALFGLSGPQAAAALRAAGLPQPETMKNGSADGSAVIRIDGDRFYVAIPNAKAAAVWQRLAAAARPAGLPAWRWLDIRAALPVICEATKEHFVPQMANFERIGGISFHKGCYPGQEIVARTQYLGKVKRHLYRLRSETAMSAGDELYSATVPDQSCGMVVSAAVAPDGGHEALAVLMEMAAETAIRLRSRDGTLASATPVAAG